MSGLGGKRDRVSNYFGVVNGKIVRNLGTTEPADMTGVSSRVKKNGDTVFELESDYIAGRIVKAELVAPKEGFEDYGDTMALTMIHPTGEKLIVQVKFDSYYGRGFMFSIPNADLTKDIELEPYKYTPRGQERAKTGLSVLQFGSQLDWAYGTKDNTGGMPPLESIVLKKKKTWDNSKQLEFLEDKFKQFAADVAAIQLGDADPLAASVPTEGDFQNEEDVDDLPF